MNYLFSISCNLFKRSYPDVLITISIFINDSIRITIILILILIYRNLYAIEIFMHYAIANWLSIVPKIIHSK